MEKLIPPMKKTREVQREIQKLLLHISEIPEDQNNYHTIAIANLQDSEYQLKKWWHKKWNIPPKNFDEYTIEELFVEMLEDYYDNHPEEINRYLDVEEEWDGTMPESYYNDPATKAFHEKHKNDGFLARYQSDEELTPEQEKEILDNVGKNLPHSTMTEEFDETF